MTLTINNKDKPALRRGKWTPEEEEYAEALIEVFKAGLLPLPEGTTLRIFLGKMLNCAPMRISKKFIGSKCIGKYGYRRCRTSQPTPQEMLLLRNELPELERRFLRSVELASIGLSANSSRSSTPPTHQEDYAFSPIHVATGAPLQQQQQHQAHMVPTTPAPSINNGSWMNDNTTHGIQTPAYMMSPTQTQQNTSADAMLGRALLMAIQQNGASNPELASTLLAVLQNNINNDASQQMQQQQQTMQNNNGYGSATDAYLAQHQQNYATATGPTTNIHQGFNNNTYSTPTSPTNVSPTSSVCYANVKTTQQPDFPLAWQNVANTGSHQVQNDFSDASYNFSSNASGL